ncbi:COMM domain containing 10 protein valette [Rhodnius prolixus]|uniref:COMM domain-containing protein n=1 Tax=Rhodnius neglectus TaxID=72488 RepID=A0A0P4VQR4_9HEMI
MTSSKNWITLSANLQAGIEIINKLENRKFHLFLNRIVKDMVQNPDSHKPFTDEEEEKLLDSLEINRNELNVLLHAAIVILTQAAYSLTNPDKLNEILIKNLKLTEEKAHVFTVLWTNDAKNVIIKFKQKSVYIRKLQDISWLVNIEMSSDNNIQTFTPKAILQMKLIEDKGTSDLTLDLDENQLSKVYNTLENIQVALDGLI